MKKVLLALSVILLAVGAQAGQPMPHNVDVYAEGVAFNAIVDGATILVIMPGRLQDINQIIANGIVLNSSGEVNGVLYLPTTGTAGRLDLSGRYLYEDGTNLRTNSHFVMDGNLGIRSGSSAAVTPFEVRDLGYVANDVLARVAGDDGNPWLLMLSNLSASTTVNHGLGFYVSNDGTANIQAGGADTTKDLVLNRSGGNVSIGTGAPDSSDWNASTKLLHLYQNTTDGATLKVESSNTKSVFSTGNNQLQIGNITADPVKIYTNSLSRVEVDANGNILMGGATVVSGTNTLTIGTGNTAISSGWYLHCNAFDAALQQPIKINIINKLTGDPITPEQIAHYAIYPPTQAIVCEYGYSADYGYKPLESFADQMGVESYAITEAATFEQAYESVGMVVDVTDTVVRYEPLFREIAPGQIAATSRTVYATATVEQMRLKAGYSFNPQTGQYNHIYEATRSVVIKSAQQQFEESEIVRANRNASTFWRSRHVGPIAELCPEAARIRDAAGNIIGLNPVALDSIDKVEKEKEFRAEKVKVSRLEKERVPATEEKNQQQDAKLTEIESKLPK